MKSDDFFNLINDAIAPSFRKVAEAGFLVHEESHHDGNTSSFSLNASVPNVAFSLDVRGKEPFGIFNAGKRKICAKNDLTVICLDMQGDPLVFVFEHKNSTDSGNAQFQIESGQAFCEYLFRLLKLQTQRQLKPRFFGIVVYRLNNPRGKGTTRPRNNTTRLRFRTSGKNGLLRAEWDMNVVLPLTELIRAAEHCG